MLHIQNISKQYKTGDFVQQALNDVSLSLRDSEFVAILGPSGSGKTTLLNIIGGLDRYDSGDLVINGISTKQYKDRDWDSYRNHTIGFVFQSYNLIPHQTILSNVELALTISGISRSERRQRARKALKQVGLGEHINKKPNQLSGGQMQRVAIARALVNDPDIVLADEPTGALDSDTSVQIMDLLKEVAKNRLVVMVTHNPELAREYATRIVELKDGVIRSDSDPFDPQSADDAHSKPVHKTMGRASMSLATSLALSFNNLKTKKGRTFLTAFAGSIGIIGIALIMSVSAGVNEYIDSIQRDTMTAYPITIDAKTFDLSSLMSAGQEASESRGEKHDSKAIYADDSAVKDASTMTSSITENNLSAFKKYLDKKSSPIHEYVGSAGIQYSYDTKFSVYTHDSDGTLVSADGVTVGSSGSSSQSMASQMASGSLMSTDTSTFTSTRMSMLTGETDQNAAPSSFHEIMPDADGKTISKVVTDNYEVVNGTWPKSSDEVVLVLDSNNAMPITTLYELGLKPASEYHEMMNALDAGDDVDTNTKAIDYSKALNQQLSLIPASDQYVKGDDGHWTYVGDDADQVADLVNSDKAIKLKIVGVVKPHADADATPLASGVGYTRALTDELIDHTDASAIVADQKADETHNVLNGMAFSPSDDATKAADAKEYVASLGVTQKSQMAKSLMSASAAAQTGTDTAQGDAANQAAMMAQMSEQQLADQFDAYIATADEATLVAIYNQYVSTGTYNDNLSAFGVVSRDAPNSINIYVDSFEDKDHIADAIADYNATASKKDTITYTDYVGLMMSSVTTIINVITYVLIAFVAVSLVVSSIMIGIITYISVLERTKEIGILRAMGASKRNVSNVFNAETGIIGLLSGVLGVGITIGLNFPINAVLHHFMETNEVNAFLPWGSAAVLVILSVILTLIGGLIPSRGAAKQDPATALRTE
ncbi:ABC transporter ATP-binding protein/permease [Bifidobacterium oedipodis]|uniref:ABC transporter n=1 Tax=Bifidobacterium oedipodis TaxID=2675322 RepID=A0A7Y0HRG2_9BIFI|nr:ABC transporter ATP-binding protein/permease [Bifidobacterium sp. DSM 109957]NMM94020.1 ABC transporter [Bifidobacterium sp. DSM 109957]